MPLSLFDHIAATDPDRIALDTLSGEQIRYGDLQGRVSATQIGAAHKPGGNPLAIQRDHGIATALIELAALQAGIPILSLPRFFTPDQTTYAARASGALALVGDGDTAAEPLANAPVDLLAGTARITFTSGSTGTPKGVCLSADHMLTVAASIVDSVGSAHAGRHLPLLPSGILLEFVGGFLPTLLAGGTYLCPPAEQTGMADPFRPDFRRMAEAIAQWDVTSLILVPEYLAGLVAQMEATGLRLPKLTLVAVGGARVPTALIARARALGLPVRQGYGLTECASVVALEADTRDDSGSVGVALPHLHLSLAEDGEILVDGPLYLGTIGSPRNVGPLRTGDIGRFDSAGRLHVTGRKSCLIITSHGRNLSPEWIEEILLAQPAIMQAMVHGDGLPLPQALLTPASADADLGAAVAAANAALPAYAQIENWREVPHFTPFNGQLTGNGRLRRDVIAAMWLQGEPDWFDQLEAATVRERLMFLTIPQLQAGLNGTISRRAYVDYLAQAFHHVSHTVPLMQAARARLSDRPELIAALDAYIEEETGHEEWILSDIAAAGGDAEAVRASQPAPATRAMVAHAYERIANGNPVAFFGMVYVLESVSVALAQRGASAVARNLGLPPEAFTYLTSHGALDQSHMHFYARLVNRLERAEDRQAILSMARDMFRLFGGVFRSIELDDTRAAA
jgi:acyl-CoA synthetase (AMP-forming)/AMP-acid ligase II